MKVWFKKNKTEKFDDFDVSQEEKKKIQKQKRNKIKIQNKEKQQMQRVLDQ